MLNLILFVRWYAVAGIVILFAWSIWLYVHFCKRYSFEVMNKLTEEVNAMLDKIDANDMLYSALTLIVLWPVELPKRCRLVYQFYEENCERLSKEEES